MHKLIKNNNLIFKKERSFSKVKIHELRMSRDGCPPKDMLLHELSKPGASFLYMSSSYALRTSSLTTLALGCPPELGGKILLLAIQDTLVEAHREIK